MRQLFYRIYATLGSRITWKSLIETTSVKSHETALAYVQHMEEAFIAEILYCFDPGNRLPNPNKGRKIYFIDPLLYFLSYAWQSSGANIFHWASRQMENVSWQGRLFESVVVADALRRERSCYLWYSAKTQQEVDLAIVRGADYFLHEIKWSRPDGIRHVLGRRVNTITQDSFAASPVHFHFNGTGVP